ncbi:cytochrome P450 [Flagelloscypha sp. PMI_526]|nr:cytochrome P450 [Flagelloscypha sp. PMI_526]
MKQQITSRQTSGDFDDKSAFSLLLKANADPDTKYPLDEEELIGNVFLFLLAGHETTAKTLTAVMSLLAIHPEVQKDIISEIREVLGTRRPVSWACFTVVYLLIILNIGALLEALRLFPPGALLFREVRYDTVVSLPPPVGMESRGPLQVPVLKGTKIYTDFVGIRSNERYFPEPEEFKPTRWAGISPDSEQLSFFSFGPRVCIGKRFALVELLAFLSCFIRDFEINPYLEGFENVEQWASKMKEGNLGVTLSPKDVPFVFKRRSLV